MTVTIAVESPLQDDVRALVSALDAFLSPLSPSEYQFQLTVEQMADPSVTLFVVRNEDGNAVGIGALKDHGDGLGEVKRMYTAPDLRGQRVGAALLARIESLAREKGIARLVLETGDVPEMMESWRLYERGGFTQCGAVLGYPTSAYNRFYEKRLS